MQVGTGDHLKEEECTLVPASHSTSPDEILLNPNVFTEFKLAGNQEVIRIHIAVFPMVYGFDIMISSSATIRKLLQMKHWSGKLVLILLIQFFQSSLKTFAHLMSHQWMVKHQLMHSMLMELIFVILEKYVQLSKSVVYCNLCTKYRYMFDHQVANMVKHLPHLWDICSLEIIVRSTKHFLKVFFYTMLATFLSLRRKCILYEYVFIMSQEYNLKFLV